MPRAKAKVAPATARKPAKAQKPAKKAARRGRRPLAVTLSPASEKASAMLARVVEQWRQERAKLRAAQALAAKVSGKGRGVRPQDPKAAKRAKADIAKARAAIAQLRQRRVGAQKQASALVAKDRVAAMVQAIRTKLESDDATGFAKVETKLARSVRAYAAHRRAELEKMETRRAKSRRKRADRAIRVAERALGRRRRK